jgi:hypothetical protein
MLDSKATGVLTVQASDCSVSCSGADTHGR